jgi:hypothetical protein
MPSYERRPLINSLTNRKMDLISLSYLLIATLIFHFIDVLDFMKVFVALPTFIILPWLFGKSLLHTFEELSHKSLQHNSWSHFIFHWLIGTYLLSVLAALLQLLRQPIILANLHILILSFITSSLTYRIFLEKSGKNTQAITHNYSQNLIIDLLLCIFIGLVPALIARTHIPFGYFGGGWLLPTIIGQTALRLIEHGYIDLPWSRLPEYLLTALSCMIFNCEPMNFNWSLSFLLAPLYSIGLYMLSHRLFKNRTISLLTAFFGVFINIGSTHRTFFFDQFIENPRSNTILYAIFPLILYTIDKEILNNRKYKIKDIITSLFTLAIFLMSEYIILESDWFKAQVLNLSIGYRLYVIKPIGMTIIPFIGFLITKFLIKSKFSKENFQQLLLIAITFQLIHQMECLLFTLTLFLYILFTQLTKEKNQKRSFIHSNLLFYTIIIFTFLFIIFQWTGLIKIYSNNPLSSLLFPSLKRSEQQNLFINKRLWFEDANSPIILSLLIIGSVLIILSKNLKKLLILTMFSSTLLIYFFPDLWTYRAYKEFSPFMAIILAISAYEITELIAKTSNRLKKTLIKQYINLLSYTLILFIVTPSLVLPVYTRFSFTPPGQQSYTIIAKYEYETALWLRENTPENTRIISDYRTMILITPLANKIWLTEKQMNVPSLNNEDQQRVSYIKNEIFLAPNSKHAYEAIWNLSNQTPWDEQLFLESTKLSQTNITFVVIISTRTVKWIEQQGINDISLPQYGGVDQKYLEKFLDINYFIQLINIDNEIYVFKVKTKS